MSAASMPATVTAGDLLGNGANLATERFHEALGPDLTLLDACSSRLDLDAVAPLAAEILADPDRGELVG